MRNRWLAQYIFDFQIAMLTKTDILMVLIVGAVFVNAIPSPTNFSVSAANQRPRPPANFRPRPFEDEWDFFCEENNVPPGTWFVHPWTCEWYLGCWEEGTFFGACEPEGAWFFPGPQNGPGTCELPADGAVCVLQNPVWPPVNGECPPAGSDELVLLPSEFCDRFYVCV